MQFKANMFTFIDNVRSSYWFLPSIMALGAVVLSYITLEIDYYLADNGQGAIRWLYTGSAQGGRTILSTIASSMIGIAGVVFSITIVALTLASNQFGPRLLRNFMRNRPNQVVLGTFISAFLFSIFVLRQIRGASEEGALDRFIPQISIGFAVVLAVASLGVLIFFIHHISLSIQAPQVILEVTHDLKHAIKHMYPSQIGEGIGHDNKANADLAQQIPRDFVKESCVVRASDSGYVQRIEPENILSLAKKHDLVVRIEHSPGDFVIAGEPILTMWPARKMEEKLSRELADAFAIGSQRTMMQDARFPAEQLVEIAVRALSPGVNDPFTAIMCVERLGDGLVLLASRCIPSPFRADDDGKLRVIAPSRGFEQFCNLAFDQIRRNAHNTLAVLLVMLEVQGKIIRLLSRPADVQTIRDHADNVRDDALKTALMQRETLQVQKAHAAIAASPGLRLRHT